MKRKRVWKVIHESLGNIKRELKICLTPVPKPDKWLFLVGCYNSGTTLLADILGKHPEISGLPTEGHFITDQFVKDYEVGLPRMWAGREELFRLTECDLGPDPVQVKKDWGMRWNLSKKILLEKSPPNTVRTRWLNQHFFPAYFVGIIRNGYAVAEGIKRKANPLHLRDGWSIEQCALQWKRSLEVLEEDSAFLDNFIWVKYEDLVDQTDKELERITDFIKVERFKKFNTKSSIVIHERNEPIRNMNQENIERLTDSQILAINEIAGETLINYGYQLID